MPLKVGVASLVGVVAEIAGVPGAVVSTSNEKTLLAALTFPAPSAAVAVTEWDPSERAVAGVKE